MQGFKYRDDLTTDEKIMVTLVRIAESFKKDLSTLFKNYGLTFPQYNVLRVLEGSETSQNTITKIGNVLLVTCANMTGIAKRLEKNGFLIRKRDLKDERVTLLEITPKGRQTLNNISKSKDENIEHYLVDFTAEEKDLLLKKLRSLLNR